MKRGQVATQLYRPFTKLIDESLLVDIFMMFQFMLRDVSQMQSGAKDRYYDYAAKVIVKMLLRLMKKLKLKTIDNVDFETISQHLKTQLKLLLEFYAPFSLSIPNCMRGMSHLVFNQPLQHAPYTNMNPQCTMMKFTNTDQPVRCGNIPTNSKSMCMLHFPLFDWLDRKVTACESCKESLIWARRS